mgnify:CR=1 FL=1
MAEGRLPTFIIIGAMKAGTTSLYRYLEVHPQITMSRRKEINFFVAEKSWNKGARWYKRQFTGPGPCFGEASPNYTKYPAFKGVPSRMHEVVPQVRLIYVVRDPLQRIVSHYKHNVDAGRELRPLVDAIRGGRENHYIQTGLYYTQVRQFLERFDEEQLLIVSLESLRRRPREVLARVVEHVGANPVFRFPLSTFRSYGTSREKVRPNPLGRLVIRFSRGLYRGILRLTPQVVGTPLQGFSHLGFPVEVRERLEELFSPEIEALKELAGESLEGWLSKEHPKS